MASLRHHTPLTLSQNPAIAYTYNEHPQQATVAKYAPSGFYIASAGMLVPGVYRLALTGTAWQT